MKKTVKQFDFKMNINDKFIASSSLNFDFFFLSFASVVEFVRTVDKIKCAAVLKHLWG